MKDFKIDYENLATTLKEEYKGLFSQYDKATFISVIKQVINKQLDAYHKEQERKKVLETFKDEERYHHSSITDQVLREKHLLQVDTYHLRNLAPLLDYFTFEELNAYFLEEAKKLESKKVKEAEENEKRN